MMFLCLILRPGEENLPEKDFLKKTFKESRWAQPPHVQDLWILKSVGPESMDIAGPPVVHIETVIYCP